MVKFIINFSEKPDALKILITTIDEPSTRHKEDSTVWIDYPVTGLDLTGKEVQDWLETRGILKAHNTPQSKALSPYKSQQSKNESSFINGSTKAPPYKAASGEKEMYSAAVLCVKSTSE